MAEPEWEFREDDDEFILVVRSPSRQHKQGCNVWIARITGADDKWEFQREFLSQSRVLPDGFIECGVPASQLQTGDVLEIFGGGVWKWQRRGFYEYFAPNGLGSLTKDEVMEMFGVPHQPKLPNVRPARRQFPLD